MTNLQACEYQTLGIVPTLHGGGGEPPSKPAAEVDTSEFEMKKSESYYHYNAENHELDPQRLVPEWPAYEYPPQMFSDENPNACTVM